MSERITESELLDALAEATAGTGPEDARTLNDLIADTGFARERLLAALRACHTAGRLVVHQVYRESILGRRSRVPAYTIAPARKSSRKRS